MHAPGSRLVKFNGLNKTEEEIELHELGMKFEKSR